MLINPYIVGAAELQFYVKSDGDDLDDGLTPGTAWATLDHAQTELQAMLPTQSQNFRVNILDAIPQTAELELVAADSGQNGFTVTWDGGGGIGQEIVGAIDAGTRIGSWSVDNYDLNIWSASYSGPAPRAIWVNGRRSMRASRGAGLIGGATLISTGYTAAGDAILTDPNPANIELVYGAWFQQPHNKVSSIAGNNILMIDPAHTYITDVPGFGYVSPLPVDVLGCQADFLNNAANGTANGTYYYDDAANILYYVPRLYIEDMATAEVIAPNGLETIVSRIGVENVTFTGLGILYSHWSMSTGFAERAQNFFYDNTSPYVTPVPADDNMPAAIYPPAAFYDEGCTNVGLTNCRLRHLSCMGLHVTLETVDSVYTGNWIDDADGNAGVIGDCIEATNVTCSSGLTVTNNVFSNYGQSLYGAAGLSIPFVAESHIDNNYFLFGTYSGITFYIGGTVDASWTTKCTNNTADRNFINYVMRQTSDGAALYVNNFAAGLSWTGNFFNYITQHDQTGGFGSEVIGGIYMDNDATFANAVDTVLRQVTNPYLFNALPATNNDSVGAGYADNNNIIVTTELPDTFTALTVSADPTSGAGAAIVAASGVGASYRPLLKSRIDGASAGAGTGTGTLTVASLEPDDLANLLIWLKADAIVGLNDGDPVVTWADSSGNANDGVAPLGNRPAYETSGINSLPTVRFTPNPTVSAQYFDLPLSEAASNYTLFFVVDNIDFGIGFAGDPQYWFSNDTGTDRLLVASPAAVASPPYPDIGYKDAPAWHYIAPRTYGVQVICVRLNSTGTAGEIFRDGVSLGTSTYTQQSLGGTTRLGSDDGTGVASPFNGDISEFFMYTRALTDPEVAQMTAYINNKYGL